MVKGNVTLAQVRGKVKEFGETLVMCKSLNFSFSI